MKNLKNNKLPFLIVLGLLSIALFKCNPNNFRYDKSGNKIYFTYYKSGKIKEEIYNNGEYRHGPYKKFDEEGNLEGTANYSNGLRHGHIKLFYKTGQIESIIHYQKDTLNGLILSYYKSGKLKSKGKYLKGKLTGEAFIYFNSGVLKEYKYYNSDGELSYSRNYNCSGKYINEEGNAIIEIFLARDSFTQPYNINDKLEADIVIANSPDCTVELVNKIINKNNPKIYKSNSITTTANKVIFTEQLNTQGKFIFRTILYLEDKNKLNKKEFCRETEINVIN